MDTQEAYGWGELFSRSPEARAIGLAERAEALGLIQEAEANGILVWRKGRTEHSRWVFVEDPSDVQSVRSVYSSEENVKSPCCFVVVKQPDPSDRRGETIFDIFRLSPASYLWHFNRVFTRPSSRG